MTADRVTRRRLCHTRGVFDLSTIGARLPVAAVTEELTGLLGSPAARLVVTAPPGSGKTTVVPVAAALARPGRVLVTQPRRIAARSAARRLVELTGSAPGELVGHTVRGESTTTSTTRVEFMTTGVLLNRLVHDPDLSGVSTVILDEVHERGLDTDLAFAMISDVAALREDLAVVVMSATLAADRWLDLLGPRARLVEVPGVLHPLTVSWAPAPAGVLPTHRGRLSKDFTDHLVDQATAMWAATTGSVLVFVPTRRDVEVLTTRLSGAGMTAMGLSGGASSTEQDRILHGGGRRIIVATSVAESALTVPGVRAVIDSGLAREPRFDTTRGMTGLVTVRESRASAEQRAGRAARLGPGVAVRCLAAEDWAGMAAEATPEAQVADLTSAVLRLAGWGSTRGEQMVWADPLPDAAVDRAVEVLRGLGALDEQERITALGRRLVGIPTDPRIARGLVEGAELVGGRAAARVVAMLSGELRCTGGDLMGLWRELNDGRGPQARTWRGEAERLERMVGSGTERSSQPVGLVTALARPDWIARRRPDGSGFLTVSGTGVQTEPGSALGRAQWLAVAEMSRVEAGAHNTSGALVRAGVEISEEIALRAGAGLLVEEESARWNPDTGRVQARRVRRLGAIVLSSTPVAASPSTIQRTVGAELAIRGPGLDAPGLLQWDDAARALRDRLGFVHRELGEPWPDMSVEALMARADQWLLPHLVDGTRGVDVVAALRSLLDWRQIAELDRVAPERLPVPSGSRIRVRYPQVDSADPPVLAVKLQECFGMTTTPRICGVSVVMELLSPAGRALAVTDDLTSFWTNVYPQVRAQNRGRYAKHPWPTDPLTAEAKRGTKRSGL